jgi:signal transduction histidine kinase/CheY-like chemotaxis protein
MMGLAEYLNRLSIRRKVFVAPLAVVVLLIVLSAASLALLRSQGAAFRDVVNESLGAATTTSRLSLTVAGIHSDIIRHIELQRLEQDDGSLAALRDPLQRRFDEAEAMLQSLEANDYVLDQALLNDAAEFLSIYRVVATRVIQSTPRHPTLISSLLAHYNQLDAYLSQLGEATILAAHTKQRRTELVVNRVAMMFLAAALVSLIIALMAVWYIGRAISAPLTEMTALMSRLAEGEHDLQVPAMQREDEVGSMARAVEVFRQASMRLRQRESDLAQMVERLATMRDQAAAANRAKSEFLASISHELRTPLNAILGYAQLLKRDLGLSEQHMTGLNTIQQSGEHLLMLINDLLDLARIEAGKLELFPHAVDMPEFLQGIGHIIRVKAEQKGLAFIYQAAADLPRTLLADEKRLRQVLLNLLGNSVKFTERGEVILRVALQAAQPDTVRLRFEIEDTGIGIPSNQRTNIFQPFEQASEVQRRFGGTGLGLPISRQLVRLMGGDIQVDSVVGKGSVFWFDLSLPLVHGETAALPAQPNVIGYQGPRKRVLVVDDIPENRAVLADTLHMLGFEVVEARDGPGALAQAQAVPPDLVLMDNLMPTMSGLEATQRLRDIPAFSSLPIIVVSASVSKADEDKTFAAGANAFLPKPIDFNALVRETGRLLGLSWIYQSRELPAARHDETVEPLVVPGPAEMERLHRLAEIGNMRDIRDCAERLAALSPQYRPFAEKLQLLVTSYQSRAILEMVERYMK